MPSYSNISFNYTITTTPALLILRQSKAVIAFLENPMLTMKNPALIGRDSRSSLQPGYRSAMHLRPFGFASLSLNSFALIVGIKLLL